MKRLAALALGADSTGRGSVVIASPKKPTIPQLRWLKMVEQGRAGLGGARFDVRHRCEIEGWVEHHHYTLFGVWYTKLRLTKCGRRALRAGEDALDEGE